MFSMSASFVGKPVYEQEYAAEDESNKNHNKKKKVKVSFVSSAIRTGHIEKCLSLSSPQCRNSIKIEALNISI